MDKQTSSPVAKPIASATPRGLRSRHSARTGEQRPKAKSPRRRGGRSVLLSCNRMSTVHLMCYCLQLEIIRDRLVQQLPVDEEPWTEAEYQQWTRACGFLKAACTSLMRLMDAYCEGPTRESRRASRPEQFDRRTPRRGPPSRRSFAQTPRPLAAWDYDYLSPTPHGFFGVKMGNLARTIAFASGAGNGRLSKGGLLCLWYGTDYLRRLRNGRLVAVRGLRATRRRESMTASPRNGQIGSDPKRALQNRSICGTTAIAGPRYPFAGAGRRS
jgi:hypothetical protein